MMINKSRFTLSALVLAMLMLAAYTNAQLVNNQHSNQVTDTAFTLAHSDKGKVKAKGAFTADFGLPGNLPLNLVAPLIERDRMYMAARPGMQNKYLPLKIDSATGNLLSGGRYLFDTQHEAEAYKNWVENDFILDGTHFFDRPIFINPDYHAWRVIGAYHFDDIDKRIIVRTERWSVSGNNVMNKLKHKWDEILVEADQRGLTSVWLLYSQDENLAQLVYFADRIVPPDPNVPDFASLAALETSPALGHHFDGTGWAKTFDRTQWVFTIWFPFEKGDKGQPSLWPHSPPLPAPYCGDGVCEVSRGESNATCPGDCPPLAGNGKCDPGENSMNCPGDCPPE
ncbi:MAG TPA: hypothetical protein VLR90_11425 [Blastocatellia bacterium]|nr:hypothetical protein [Blastocatellia bacterium]